MQRNSPSQEHAGDIGVPLVEEITFLDELLPGSPMGHLVMPFNTCQQVGLIMIRRTDLVIEPGARCCPTTAFGRASGVFIIAMEDCHSGDEAEVGGLGLELSAVGLLGDCEAATGA